MTRLRRSSVQDAGWRRVRAGRGFRYLAADGTPLPPEQARRVRDLVIPPAWTDVWICPYSHGHLQAVGTDEAGRRQYLYHPEWRVQRDLEKFERVTTMAAHLPAVRRTLRRHQDAGFVDGHADERATLATAVRLLDLGAFRIGSEVYTEVHGSYGLTTLQRRHVTVGATALSFAFVGKSGVEHTVQVTDERVRAIVASMARARRGASPLLAVRGSRSWVPLRPAAINEYIADLFGMEVSAKDFRTWHATVVAAAALAETPAGTSRTTQRKAVRGAIAEVAELLGNTPAVARSSYIDPRVLEHFDHGRVIEPARGQDALDRAVVRLLTS